MNILERKKIEDCFDGSSVYGYVFDTKWTRETIHELRSLGELEYFPDFPRPFFRLRGEGGLQVKGVEGENNCRVIFPRQKKEVVQENFEKHVQK